MSVKRRVWPKPQCRCFLFVGHKVIVGTTSAHVVGVIEPARERRNEGGKEMAISEQKKQYVVRMQSNAVTNWKNRAPRVEKVKLNIRFSAGCGSDKNARERTYAHVTVCIKDI